MKIRRARATDKRAVRAMLARLWRDDYIPDVFDEWVRDRRGGLWVAVEDGAIVGIAKLTLLGDREAWFHALRVDPRYHRRGIGTALLAHRLERARRLGARTFRLDTAADNVAVHRLMRRFGFRRIETFTAVVARARAGDAPPRASAKDAAAVLRILVRGDGLFHTPYTVRRVTRADVAGAAREGKCLVTEDAAAIVEPWNRTGLPTRLAIYALGGTSRGVTELLRGLRAEAKRHKQPRVGFAAPSRWWRAARAAGYRKVWPDAMHIFERKL